MDQKRRNEIRRRIDNGEQGIITNDELRRLIDCADAWDRVNNILFRRNNHD